MRLLLLKHDEITRLEESLDRIDAAEDRELFLGSTRLDRNPARQEVLAKLKVAISEYGNHCLLLAITRRMTFLDEMILQNHEVVSLHRSDSRDVTSLKNWVEGTSSITRAESAYLYENDHFNLCGPTDSAIARTESFVENCMVKVKCHIGKVR